MKKNSFRAVPRAGAPAPGTLMPTRVGNFANPAATDPIAPGDRIGRAVFTPGGELLWIYGAADSGHGGFWRLHAARTGNILAYRGGHATLEDADVDISSGWTQAPLGDLLLGGNANLPDDAFIVLLDPAIAALDGVSFVFWTCAFQPQRVLGAYCSQLGSWSPLIALYTAADAEGNGTTPLLGLGLSQPVAAYAFGDSLHVITSRPNDFDLEVSQFHPADIRYSPDDQASSVVVSYENQPDQGVKPGPATWVRRASRRLTPAQWSGGTANAAPILIGACVNAALGEQAYVLLDVVHISGTTKGRSNAILPLDRDTGLPASGAAAVPVSGVPRVDPSELQSLLLAPVGKIRSVSRRDGSGTQLDILYLDDGAVLEGGRVVFRSPRWQGNAADPSFEVPDDARPLARDVTQAIVYTPPFPDPVEAPAGDPALRRSFLNAFNVFFTKANDSAGKPTRTLYMTQRVGRAEQEPSWVTPAAVQPAELAAAGDDKDVIELLGVMDGPLPVPNTNVEHLVGGFLGSDIAKVLVGRSTSAANTHSVERLLGAGVSGVAKAGIGFRSKVESGFLEFGLGASVTVETSWMVNAVLKTGFFGSAIHGYQNTVRTTTHSNYVGRATLAPGASGKTFVEKAGALFADRPVIHRTVYRFRDNTGQIANADQEAFTLSRGPSTQIARSFTTLAGTPGNLDSYSHERINADMKARYDKLSPEDKKHFDPKDYEDYVNRVVMKHATLLGEDKRYLEIAWSNGGLLANSFEKVVENMNLQGSRWTWNFSVGAELDYSLEMEVDAGALVLETEAAGRFALHLELLATHKGEITRKNTSEAAERYGISGDLSLLRAGLHPGETKAYTVRIFLLQPSQLWTSELIYMAGLPGINPTSRPWKVMYIVDPVTIERV